MHLKNSDVLAGWLSPRYRTDIPRFDRNTLEKGAVLDDFFLPERLRPIEGFMLEGAEYWENCVKLVGGKEIPIERADWDSLPEAERFCLRKIVKNAQPGFENTPGFRAYQELRDFFVSPAFATLVFEMTGLLCRVAPMGAVQMDRQSLLAFHSDEVPGRTLNIICYLSSGWSPGFGGELTVAHPAWQNRVVPLFNRLVLLEPTDSAQHKVEPLTEQAGEWRRLNFVCRGKDPRFKSKDKVDDYT